MCEVPPFVKAMLADSEALFSQRDHSHCFVVLYDAVWSSEFISSHGKINNTDTQNFTFCT